MLFTDAQIEHYKIQGYLSGVTVFQRKVCAASSSTSGRRQIAGRGLEDAALGELQGRLRQVAAVEAGGRGTGRPGR